MGDIRLIKEIGCTQDGGVWLTVLLDIEGKEYTVICPMDNKKAKEVRGALDVAITRGAEWLKTGVNPDVRNSTNPNQSKLEGNKRHSHG